MLECWISFCALVWWDTSDTLDTLKWWPDDGARWKVRESSSGTVSNNFYTALIYLKTPDVDVIILMAWTHQDLEIQWNLDFGMEGYKQKLSAGTFNSFLGWLSSISRSYSVCVCVYCRWSQCRECSTWLIAEEIAVARPDAAPLSHVS